MKYDVSFFHYHSYHEQLSHMFRLVFRDLLPDRSHSTIMEEDAFVREFDGKV